MIDRLVIDGFQAHEHLDLRPSPGVFVIVGKSDTGKSSILRALRWLALNNPAGVEFIRFGAKTCNVAARVDGKWVQRRRTLKENVYQLGDEDPHQLERGGAVPQAVRDLLNVGPVNFATQHEPPFWLADTPGQVAKNLNDIVNLSEIDEVMARAADGVRDARADVRACERELEDAEQQLEGTPDVGAVGTALDVLESLVQEADAKLRQRDKCDELLLQLLGCRTAAHAEAARSGTKALTAGEELREVQSRISGLRQILSDLRTPVVDIKGWDQLLALRAAADLASEERAYLEGLVDDAARAGDQAWQAEQDLALAERQLAELGPICPACQRPLDPPPSSSQIPTSAPQSRAPAPNPARTGPGSRSRT